MGEVFLIVSSTARNKNHVDMDLLLASREQMRQALGQGLPNAFSSTHVQGFGLGRFQSAARSRGVITSFCSAFGLTAF